MSLLCPFTLTPFHSTLVSEALSAAGIDAILGGGGAVTLYSNNEYMSTDLDSITTERNTRITPVVAKLDSMGSGVCLGES